MGRGIVDFGNMDRADIVALREARPPQGLPFRVAKLGHVVQKVQDLERVHVRFSQPSRQCGANNIS